MTVTAEVPAAKPGEPLGFTRVLVVDDEAPLRHMLELLLRRERYQVLHADSGEAAIELLGREDVDVVLTDARMPGMPAGSSWCVGCTPSGPGPPPS
ncbi:MAG: response regulator [Nannocystaceae bacterium]